ncbi:DUF3179 domain-containing protein [Patescibacteria group bacterium]|nr:DUF3179 domain-containing protein [Patescibacteria group bacterium]MBU4453021.1 DUF3179 domain-containing protein [Patescibacteria group bacterium]MCG2687784.1 DUF3179 domain-containing protein [Candidatus Parcubacteria bacterium]
MQMKKQHINILLGIGLFIIIIAGLYAIRAWRMAKVKELMQTAELPYGLLEESVSYDGDNYLIPPTQIYDSGTILPALDNPKFDTVIEADSYLADDVEGIDVEINGAHRFYSYQILNWHEVVNDSFGGKQLAITHCVFCKSSAVYNRVIDGKTINLQNSGKIYNNNQLLESNDGSLWLQLRGLGVSGKYINQKLDGVTFQVVTWQNWKEHYPNGEVLSNDTGYVRDYGMHPYQNYDTAKTIYYPMNVESKYMSVKWEVEGLAINNDAIAFSDDIMKGMYVANEVVDSMPITGFWNSDLERTLVYSSVVGDQTLTFTFDSGTQTMTDDQTSSTWDSNGKALSGALFGTQLSRIQTKPSFWMCWYSQYPQTQIAFIDTETDPESDSTDQTEGSTLQIDTQQSDATIE